MLWGFFYQSSFQADGGKHLQRWWGGPRVPIVYLSCSNRVLAAACLPLCVLQGDSRP